jgi:hypothetical protein
LGVSEAVWISFRGDLRRKNERSHWHVSVQVFWGGREKSDGKRAKKMQRLDFSRGEPNG